jgi:hypothetical protein
MQYMVIWSDGNKYGPADLALLNQWAAEGRITPDTDLEPVAGGPTIKAATLPGLVIPGASTPVTADSAASGMPTSPIMAVQTASAPHEATISPTSDPSASSTHGAVAPSIATPSQYYVIGPGGAKYGPADVKTLTQWKAENRLNDASELEDASTGRRVTAAALLGASPAAAPTMGQPGMPTQTGYQQPGAFGQPGAYQQQPMSPYSQAPQNYADPEAGKKEFNQSIIAAVVGLFCCGFIAPALGLYYGSQAKKLGHPNGQVAIIINAVVLVINVVGVLVALMGKR